MATTLVTQSMLLDLEAMTRAHAAFADRLNALLDALAVPPHGQGRAKWLVKAAGIQPVAAGKWFTGTKPRRSNLTTLAAFITANYPVNATQDELLDYLTGKYVALDVNAELARSGLTPPEQGFVQTVVARAMKDKGLDPLAPEQLPLWTKVVIHVARYYAIKVGKGPAPDEDTVLATAAAFLELAILDAI